MKGRVFKIEISKVSSSALAAEICTGPHNRLLRRQHCSSLCSQSEGHEHVANMTNALGHYFVEFSARAWPPQYSPPHFASKVSYSASPQTYAKCPRGASVPTLIFWILNIHPIRSSRARDFPRPATLFSFRFRHDEKQVSACRERAISEQRRKTPLLYRPLELLNCDNLIDLGVSTRPRRICSVFNHVFACFNVSNLQSGCSATK